MSECIEVTIRAHDEIVFFDNAQFFTGKLIVHLGYVLTSDARAWLTEHVGVYQTDWDWVVYPTTSSHHLSLGFRFCDEGHAIAFKLRFA
jgi:hypothetical protein